MMTMSAASRSVQQKAIVIAAADPELSIIYLYLALSESRFSIELSHLCSNVRVRDSHDDDRKCADAQDI